jgi:glutamine amidotransferase
VAKGDFLVLPGVGAFGDGLSTLRKRGLVEPVLEWIGAGRPFLGICLGMQLLLGQSEEFGLHEGLGVIPGSVRRLPQREGSKVPNVGWFALQPPQSHAADVWRHTALSDFPADRDVYFVHSYAAYPEDRSHWLARTAFGDHWFCSVVRRENVHGCQFHPEKSGPAGLRVLEGFLAT